jgi:hypothetical protein
MEDEDVTKKRKRMCKRMRMKTRRLIKRDEHSEEDEDKD